MLNSCLTYIFFFFNDTATTEIYTLSLHDALPISRARAAHLGRPGRRRARRFADHRPHAHRAAVPQLWLGHGRLQGHRSEEHTSELQSRQYLVCRLLLEKKKTNYLFLSI